MGVGENWFNYEYISKAESTGFSVRLDVGQIVMVFFYLRRGKKILL